MTEVYRFSETEILFFALVLVRMTAFVVTWPVFGTENVAGHIKILFATVLTLLVFPTLHWSEVQQTALSDNLILLVVREAFIGLTIGYLARLFFFTFRIVGELVSQSMGLNSASVFNPAMGGQTGAVEQYYFGLVTLFYLGIDGHHVLLIGLVKSFEMVPAAIPHLNVSQFPGVGQMSQEILELGLRLSAPVMVSILVINLVLGVVGKTVPQLNVLVTSFPINIMIGFFLMMVTLPMLLGQMNEFLALSTTRVFDFIKTF